MAMDGDDLGALGFSGFFAEQVAEGERDLVPCRIATVHRARVTGLTVGGVVRPILPFRAGTNDFAVGDWVLLEEESLALIRRLERRTVLERHTEGARVPQLIAANVDTLFVVTSANADFNAARLERYLALANEAGTEPVVVLTKADLAGDVAAFVAVAEGLQRGLSVVVVDARGADVAELLGRWCGAGRTVALVGSSGVGKSTLLNSLAAEGAVPQETGAIREADAKGRHTTTGRSLHAIAGGGWVIDTPGMRTLHLMDAGEGIGALFAEITELAPLCRFRDCTHGHEPGCAVRAAVAEGKLDPERVARWRKLLEESDANVAQRDAPKGLRGKRR